MVDTIQLKKLAQFQKPLGVVASKKMNRLRWKIARTHVRGARHSERSVVHSSQGLETNEIFSVSGRGRNIPLTFPFIEQAIALTTDHE
jgi:hypothetical protein